MRSDIDALYKKAKAILWVEDIETRTWLEAIWAAEIPPIQVLVARGRGGVEAVCEDAKRAGHKHVFGLVDRDFGTSNRVKWSSMDEDQRIYRLHVNEFENFLLCDIDALLGCSMHTGKRTRPDVEQRIDDGAKKRIWWVTCVRFLAETQRRSKDGYPSDPKFAKIQSLFDAENHVLSSIWFTTTARDCPNLVEPTTVKSELLAIYAMVEQQFNSGQWKDEFPGKEIFKEIATYLSPTNSGLDFIKSIGIWQRDNAKQNNTPLPLADLRKSIEDRI